MTDRSRVAGLPASIRLSMAGLVLAVIAFVVGTTVIPTHVSFGAGSLQCGTVLHPDTEGEITGPYCGRAGASQLRASLLWAAMLALLALVPVIVHWTSPRSHPILWASWTVMMVLVALLGAGYLGWAVEYSASLDHADLADTSLETMVGLPLNHSRGNTLSTRSRLSTFTR